MQKLVLAMFIICWVLSVGFQAFGLRNQKLATEAWYEVDGSKEYAYYLLQEAFARLSIGIILLAVSSSLFLLYTLLFGFQPVE